MKSIFWILKACLWQQCNCKSDKIPRGMACHPWTFSLAWKWASLQRNCCKGMCRLCLKEQPMAACYKTVLRKRILNLPPLLNIEQWFVFVPVRARKICWFQWFNLYGFTMQRGSVKMTTPILQILLSPLLLLRCQAQQPQKQWPITCLEQLQRILAKTAVNNSIPRLWKEMSRASNAGAASDGTPEMFQTVCQVWMHPLPEKIWLMIGYGNNFSRFQNCFFFFSCSC